MRDTVFVLSELADQAAVEASIEKMVASVKAYVPGYRLKQRVQFDVIAPEHPLNVPRLGPRHGLRTSVYLEVEGAAHYLPSYAGNLDIMTSAALACGDMMAQRRIASGIARGLSRSRNASHPAPPPQIRTCGATAYGSCLGS
jgi:acetaldehyde dehydrogenase